jgi:hypothetical protein
MESHWSGDNVPEHKGEAAHTIPGECERLFCNTLSAIFLGEGRFARQELLGVGAYQVRPSDLGHAQSRVQKWVEVLDYTSDGIYRGFVTALNGERTLFIFFGEQAPGQDLKTGYVSPQGYEQVTVKWNGDSQLL